MALPGRAERRGGLGGHLGAPQLKLDWEAAYLDGRSAARQRATARIGRAALEITLTDSQTRLLWPYREIRQTQGTYAGEHVRLERGGDLSEALLVPDVAFLSALREAAPGHAVACHLYTEGGTP